MDSKSLTSFITVCQTRSFTKAAEKLHITQPALSKRISLLEAELGSQLIIRHGKQLKLSQAGTVFLKHAQQLIHAINNCQTELSNLEQYVQGSLRLGVSHHIGLHRIPPFLKSFTKRYPDVHLNIQFVDSEQAYNMVANGELEIALATMAPEKPQSITEKHIWHDPLGFFASSEHKLANTNKLSLATLSQHDAVLPAQKTYTGRLIEQLFKQQHLSINHFIETNYLETIKMMTSIGIGWSVLPLSMASDELHKLPLNDIKLKRDLGLIYNNDFILSNAATAFINIFENTNISS